MMLMSPDPISGTCPQAESARIDHGRRSFGGSEFVVSKPDRTALLSTSAMGA